MPEGTPASPGCSRGPQPEANRVRQQVTCKAFDRVKFVTGVLSSSHYGFVLCLTAAKALFMVCCVGFETMSAAKQHALRHSNSVNELYVIKRSSNGMMAVLTRHVAATAASRCYCYCCQSTAAALGCKRPELLLRGMLYQLLLTPADLRSHIPS